jgi:MGT family glycosyltransferase
LFVVPPLVGHVNPAASIAEALRHRGHDVAWVAHQELVGRHLPAGSRVYPPDASGVEAMMRDAFAAARKLDGAHMRRTLWEKMLFPFARAMFDPARAAIDDYEPDLVLVDAQAAAGAIAARATGVRWASLVTTPAPLARTLSKPSEVGAWFASGLETLYREWGIAPVDLPLASPDLILVPSIRTLAAHGTELPAQVEFVGSVSTGRTETVPFPFDALMDRPRILVSLGTLNAAVAGDFHRRVVSAFDGAALQVILTGSDDVATPVPRNFIVRQFVPQVRVLAEVDAVVCHGGHNTVVESLAAGRPLVVLPIVADQPEIAERVAAAGLGIRLGFWEASPAELRDSVLRLLHVPQFRAAAARAGQELSQAGGADRAADLLLRNCLGSLGTGTRESRA